MLIGLPSLLKPVLPFLLHGVKLLAIMILPTLHATLVMGAAMTLVILSIKMFAVLSLSVYLGTMKLLMLGAKTTVMMGTPLFV